VHHIRIYPLLFLSCLSLLAGCTLKDSPAPGCVQRVGAAYGGCGGKTLLEDLVVEPQLDCLKLDINNCNGGILSIRNDCSDVLILEQISIPARGSADLDVKRKTAGGYTLVEADGNVSHDSPAQDERIEAAGKLGSQSIRLSFTKTGPLCD